MDFCPRCDARNPPGSAFCRKCGGQLLAQATVPTGPASRPQVTLRIVRADGGPETQVPMTAEELVCGRTTGIPLGDDPFVADPQVRFFFSALQLAVEDVGGGNGVFVRIRNERQVPLGAELRVGRQRLLLQALPACAPGPGGVIAWGSPDEGVRLRLVQLLEGGIWGSTYPLHEGDNTVGREAGDLTFPTDGFVSGRHALLTVSGEQVTLRDLGSSNGTFLRLAAPAVVDDEDQFLVGRQLIRVELRPSG